MLRNDLQVDASKGEPYKVPELLYTDNQMLVAHVIDSHHGRDCVVTSGLIHFSLESIGLGGGTREFD